MRSNFHRLPVLVLVFAFIASAHAILLKSTPAGGATLPVGSPQLTLEFNSKIDAARSTISLNGPNQEHQSIATVEGKAANVLQGTLANLKPGSYHLLWQVLAIDGHITRGQISFKVQ